MKIKYIHHSEPDTVKVYDTVVALKNNPFIHMPQEEFDRMELAHMERDEKKGYILFYEKIPETPELTHNLIVHCNTEAEAKMLMHIAEEQGHVWGSCAKRPTENTYFHVYQEDTCYRFHITKNRKYLSYSDRDFFEQKQFPITEFGKFFFGVSFEEYEKEQERE